MQLIELTLDNWGDAIALEVADNQEDYIASNVKTIAQSKFMPYLEVRAMGNEEGMVGLVAYVVRVSELDDKKPDSGYIMRFMVDANHQGKGYGRTLLDLTVETIKREEPSTRYIYLSVVPENTGATGFYRKMGFEPTGEKAGSEDVYRLTL
ncbi:MAG: GNAT family N-acetyltransferase [Candidatus Kariarchaeaceae archaeon]|jgi:diamine N-acetyltransferase